MQKYEARMERTEVRVDATERRLDRRMDGIKKPAAGYAHARQNCGKGCRTGRSAEGTGLQLRVARAIHFAHPTRTDQSKYFVGCKDVNRIEVLPFSPAV